MPNTWLKSVHLCIAYCVRKVPLKKVPLYAKRCVKGNFSRRCYKKSLFTTFKFENEFQKNSKLSHLKTRDLITIYFSNGIKNRLGKKHGAGRAALHWCVTNDASPLNQTVSQRCHSDLRSLFIRFDFLFQFFFLHSSRSGTYPTGSSTLCHNGLTQWARVNTKGQSWLFLTCEADDNE